MHEPTMMMKSLLFCLSVLLFLLISFNKINGYPSGFFKYINDTEEGELKNVWTFDTLAEEDKLAPPREDILQKMQEIFGIKSQSEISSHRKVLPQFMIELYNTIADSNDAMLNPYNSKIIRSFIETDSSLPHFYFFNISGLGRDESVLEAELHLYKKKTPLKNINSLKFISPYYYVVKVFQVLDNKSLDMPHLHRLLNVRYVDAYTSGWQVFNVKQAVLGWMNGEPNLGLLVVASSLFQNDIDIDFFHRNESDIVNNYSKQPILVLFNNEDTEHYSGKNITPPYYAYDNYENKKYFNYENERKAEKLGLEDNYDTHKEQQGQLEEAQLANRHQLKFFQRQKRKRENKLDFPDYQREYIHETLKRHRRDIAAYEKRSPEIISENTRIKKTLTSIDIYNRAQLRERMGETFSNRSIKQHRERRSVNNSNEKKEMKQNSQECRKHNFYVDFEMLGGPGITTYIIAPQGYNADFCHGACEAPLNKDQYPTNHAIVQATVYFHTRMVEKPCCVPTKLSDLTVLYTEDQQNVVLKTYKEMRVEQCGCR